MPESTPTILLVDDEDAVRKVLAFPLEKDGYTVVQAADGEEALRRFARHAGRPRRARHHAAAARRARGLQAAALDEHGADHHADGARRRARQGDRPRARRRRLHHEAVLDPRVPLARARPAPPRPRAPRAPGESQDELIEHDGLAIDVPRRVVEVRGEPVQLTYVEFELLRALAAHPGPRLQPPDAARGALEERRLPGSAHDRRPRAPSAREARGRAADAGVHPDGARRRLPLPRPVSPLSQRARQAGARAPPRGGRRARDRLPDRRPVLPDVAREHRARTGCRSSMQKVALPHFPPSRTSSSSSRTMCRRATNARVVVFSLTSETADAARGRSPIRPPSATRRELQNDPVRCRSRPAPSGRPRHRSPRRPELRRGGLPRRRARRRSCSRPRYTTSCRRSRSCRGACSSRARSRWRSRSLFGYAGASLFTRRIRRLETAAERIAEGRFDEPVVDHGSDEVGQLARTFERMRLRLANLDRARGEFIANASHELRTPLFSLGGFLELLDDPELDEATRDEFVGQMREQVARLTKLATEPPRPLAARRGPADRRARAARPRRARAGSSRRSSGRGRLPPGTGSSAPAEPGAPAQGDSGRVLQIGRVLVENALVHTPAGHDRPGHDGGRRRPRHPDGRERRPVHPGGGSGADLRALLPPRRRPRLRERARPRDRAGAGRGDGRPHRARLRRTGWTLFTLVLSADVPEREPAAGLV